MHAVLEGNCASNSMKLYQHLLHMRQFKELKALNGIFWMMDLEIHARRSKWYCKRDIFTNKLAWMSIFFWQNKCSNLCNLKPIQRQHIKAKASTFLELSQFLRHFWEFLMFESFHKSHQDSFWEVAFRRIPLSVNFWRAWSENRADYWPPWMHCFFRWLLTAFIAQIKCQRFL